MATEQLAEEHRCPHLSVDRRILHERADHRGGEAVPFEMIAMRIGDRLVS